MRVLSSSLATAAIAAGAFATSAGAGTGPPPPPTAVGGQTVTQVAVGGGIATPTSFAFGKGQVFEGDAGKESNGPPHGGVYLLKGGTGVKLAGSPMYVSGLAWHKDALYVSGGSLTSPKNAVFTIQKWSGWNGTAFAKRTAIYTAPKKFQGFTGIAFGPDGRLYVGTEVGLTNNNDHGPATKSPYLYDILSMKSNGKGFKVFATGLREPWQMAFAPNSRSPLVSDLGQNSGVKNPPDFVLKVHGGDNFGFPGCNHTVAAKCKGFAKPLKLFPPHTDIMGMAIIGKTLYMTSFLGTRGKGPGGEVVSMPLRGGPLTPVLTGFVAPTVGLGQNAGTLYVGELTGQVFSVKP